jgi:hypothetical protein
VRTKEKSRITQADKNDKKNGFLRVKMSAFNLFEKTGFLLKKRVWREKRVFFINFCLPV